jgi:hypothetical protein
MTRQESFNHICRNLIAAPRPSTYWNSDSESNVCVYRGPDNTRCAVGWILPDYAYTPSVEGHSVLRLLVDIPHLMEDPLISPWEPHDLSDLQYRHDEAANRWHDNLDWGVMIHDSLIRFAAEHDLQMEV